MRSTRAAARKSDLLEYVALDAPHRVVRRVPVP